MEFIFIDSSSNDDETSLWHLFKSNIMKMNDNNDNFDEGEDSNIEILLVLLMLLFTRKPNRSIINTIKYQAEYSIPAVLEILQKILKDFLVVYIAQESICSQSWWASVVNFLSPLSFTLCLKRIYKFHEQFIGWYAAFTSS